MERVLRETMREPEHDPLCGDCGLYHPRNVDCGPDPDGSYPCKYDHMGCSDRLHGRCDNETHWRDEED